MTLLVVDPQAQAALDATVKGDCLLIEAEFSTGTIYMTNWSHKFDADTGAGSHTYMASNLLNVSGLQMSQDASTSKVTVSLGLASAAMLAASLGPSSVYRNRKIRVYLQLMGSDYQPSGAPVKIWYGRMDQMGHKRNVNGRGPSHGAIEMKCTRIGLAQARQASPLRLSHEQHVKRNPGSTGLRYLSSLVNEPTPWLTKAFQEQQLG